jgi:hypothetical protein
MDIAFFQYAYAPYSFVRRMKIDVTRNVNCNSDTLWILLSRRARQAKYVERVVKGNIQNILGGNSDGMNS